jgi:hypothetical protein
VKYGMNNIYNNNIIIMAYIADIFLHPSLFTPFPVSPKGEKLKIILLLPPWGKAG